ncbi:MAG TPA: hypothetical protein VMQ59_13360, partial [Acidimicrobiales bacterium]|nr:hypothetical protein [Acidimicrobiales bacterium]
QADVDAGVVNNTATAQATPPGGPPIASGPSSTSTPVNQSSGLTIVKSAAVTDVNSDGKTDLGDTIAWSYLVTNTGTVTLTGVGVTDPTAGATTCPSSTLAPGAAETCTATTAHTISQADVDAGVVNNTATAQGTPPGGTPISSGPSSTSTPVNQSPMLAIVKSAAVTDVNHNGVTDLGDTIAWSYLVTNTGTVTLTSVGVTDPTAGATTCPSSTLAPGAAETCTATTAHTITQGDAVAGVVNNTANARGTSPSGTAITSAPSSTSTKVQAASSGGGTATPNTPTPIRTPITPIGLAFTGTALLRQELAGGSGLVAAGLLLLVGARRRRNLVRVPASGTREE